MGQHATIHGKTAEEWNGQPGRWLPISVNSDGQLQLALISGEDQEANVLVVHTNGPDYETVAASQTDQTLGATGATGDFLGRLICVVTTAATAQVQIKDGSGSAITVLPNSPGAGVGTYTIDLGIKSVSGPWRVTTGAGVSVIACGSFV